MGEWKEYKLEEIVLFQRGHDLPKTEMLAGKYPVAGSNGIIGYHNNFTTKGPGVTIGRSGNIGNPQYYETDYWAHNTVLYVKEFRNGFPKFIYYFLITLDFTQFNAGSAVPTLNRNHIHDLRWRFPEIPEQKSIASILSSLDDKIDLLYRQNKTLEALAETLFRQWFVEEADESWELIGLESIIDVISGYNHKIDELGEYGDLLLSMGSVIKSYGIDLSATRFINSNTIDNKYLCSIGDIIITTRDITQDAVLLGSPGIIPEYLNKIKIYVGSNLYRIEKKQNLLSAKLLYWLLRSENYRNYVKEVASGTSILMLKKSDLMKFTFHLPPKVKLNYIEQNISKLQEKIEKNINNIRTLTQLRDTLLPKLMSGEVRVKI